MLDHATVDRARNTRYIAGQCQFRLQSGSDLNSRVGITSTVRRITFLGPGQQHPISLRSHNTYSFSSIVRLQYEVVFSNWLSGICVGHGDDECSRGRIRVMAKLNKRRKLGRLCEIEDSGHLYTLQCQSRPLCRIALARLLLYETCCLLRLCSMGCGQAHHVSVVLGEA